MDKQTPSMKAQDPRPGQQRNQHRTAPAEPQLCTPLTPPATDELGRRDHLSLEDARLLHELRSAQDQDAIEHPVFSNKFNISKAQFDQLSEVFEQDLRRFDYEPNTEVLTLRMPSPVHDFFSASFADEVRDWLRTIVDGKGDDGDFASSIANGGSSRVLLEEVDPEVFTGPVRRQPDAQFQHRDTAYPGVVLEVSYSQDGKDLQKAAQDYILYSNGDIKRVIGIDINYGGRESTVSSWSPQYTCRDDEDYEVLEARQDIAYKPFRSADGLPINTGEYLQMNLRDFATDEIPVGQQSATLSISFKRLFDLVAQAEQIQQSREPSDGRTKVKSTRRTQKRRHSSSPVDVLRSEDEADFLGREARAIEQAEAADNDFEAPGPKRRA